MTQPVINASEIATTREQQLLNGKNSHVFTYNKIESASGLYQHGYHEFTLVLTGRYLQEINGKRMLLGRGGFISIPLGSHHQSFYELSATRILSIRIGKRSFEQYCLPLLPYCFVVSQVYWTNDVFLTYAEIVISLLSFRETGLEEFVEMVTFRIINRLRHYRKEQMIDDIPQWLRSTVKKIHDKEQFNESALKNMATLSAKSQEYSTRVTQRYYSRTPVQIISEIRINFTKKQLEVASYPVVDIAFETGYSSPSLFAKTFKKLASFTLKSCHKRLTELNQ